MTPVRESAERGGFGKEGGPVPRLVPDEPFPPYASANPLNASRGLP
jgi:hypothetical protein